MSLSQAMATAMSGLRVTQAGIAITSGNVANAETPGYVRKTQGQVSTAAEQRHLAGEQVNLFHECFVTEIAGMIVGDRERVEPFVERPDGPWMGHERKRLAELLTPGRDDAFQVPDDDISFAEDALVMSERVDSLAEGRAGKHVEHDVADKNQPDICAG